MDRCKGSEVSYQANCLRERRCGGSLCCGAKRCDKVSCWIKLWNYLKNKINSPFLFEFFQICVDARGPRCQIKQIAIGRGDVVDGIVAVQKIRDNVSCQIKTVKLLEKWNKLTVFYFLPIMGGCEGSGPSNQAKCWRESRCGRSQLRVAKNTW